jgi:hypothetical protein
MREQTLECDPNKDAICRKVGRLARAFQTMNDETVSFHGEVPQIKLHAGQIDFAARGILQRVYQGAAYSLLKILRVGVDAKPTHYQDEQQKERAHEVREYAHTSTARRLTDGPLRIV